MGLECLCHCSRLQLAAFVASSYSQTVKFGGCSTTNVGNYTTGPEVRFTECRWSFGHSARAKGQGRSLVLTPRGRHAGHPPHAEEGTESSSVHCAGGPSALDWAPVCRAVCTVLCAWTPPPRPTAGAEGPPGGAALVEHAAQCLAHLVTSCPPLHTACGWALRSVRRALAQGDRGPYAEGLWQRLAAAPGAGATRGRAPAPGPPERIAARLRALGLTPEAVPPRQTPSLSQGRFPATHTPSFSEGRSAEYCECLFSRFGDDGPREHDRGPWLYGGVLRTGVGRYKVNADVVAGPACCVARGPEGGGARADACGDRVAWNVGWASGALFAAWPISCRTIHHVVRGRGIVWDEGGDVTPCEGQGTDTVRTFWRAPGTIVPANIEQAPYKRVSRRARSSSGLLQPCGGFWEAFWDHSFIQDQISRIPPPSQKCGNAS